MKAVLGASVPDSFASGFIRAWVLGLLGAGLLWLGVNIFQGGPQTGQEHALPATFAMLLISIGLTQWLWLLPLLAWFFRSGRGRALRGLLAGGLSILLLDAPVLWRIFASR